MKRPLPIVPKGRARRPARPPTVLVACPRVSPEYALAAFHALVRPKPFRRSAIEHRSGTQVWPADGDALVADTRLWFARYQSLELTPHLHQPGDLHLAVVLPAAQLEQAKALAVVLSVRLRLWLSVGRYLVLAGRFYRFEGRNIRRLVPAKSVHLPLSLRRAIRPLLLAPPAL